MGILPGLHRSSQIDIFDTQPLITLTHRLGISTGNDGNMQPAFHSQLQCIPILDINRTHGFTIGVQINSFRTQYPIYIKYPVSYTHLTLPTKRIV